MLWMLSLVMFVGSCVAGSLPLVINLSEVRYRSKEYFMYIKLCMYIIGISEFNVSYNLYTICFP